MKQRVQASLRKCNSSANSWELLIPSGEQACRKELRPQGPVSGAYRASASEATGGTTTQTNSPPAPTGPSIEASAVLCFFHLSSTEVPNQNRINSSQPFGTAKEEDSTNRYVSLCKTLKRLPEGWKPGINGSFPDVHGFSCDFLLGDI